MTGVQTCALPIFLKLVGDGERFALAIERRPTGQMNDGLPAVELRSVAVLRGVVVEPAAAVDGADAVGWGRYLGECFGDHVRLGRLGRWNPLQHG